MSPSISAFGVNAATESITITEIELAIREKAGVISKKIEGNPLSPEKIEKEKKVAEKEEAEKEATPPKKN